MKYTYKCDTCGKERTIEKTIKAYNPKGRVYCLGNREHSRRLMKRVYQPTPAQYIGDGFTGAMGARPKMNKEERKKDLASNSGIKG